MANAKFLYKSDHTLKEQQCNSKQQQHIGNIVQIQKRNFNEEMQITTIV